MALITVDGVEVVDFRGRLPVRRGAGRYPARSLEGITMVVIHYSGVDADSSAREIASYQTSKTAGDLFPECAYSFVIRQDGRIEQCHDLETRTWHAGGRNNDEGIGICLPGSDWPTEAQIASAAALIRSLNGVLGRELRVAGHKELSATPCPGPGWEKWRSRLRYEGERERVREGGIFFPSLTHPVAHGFGRVYGRLGEELCGVPLGPEVHDEDGNGFQPFSRCEMRWDKAENKVWVSFSDE